MGDMGLNPECWPDPQAMVDELRMLGIELMITFWPFVGLPYDNGTAVSRHWDEFNTQVGASAQSACHAIIAHYCARCLHPTLRWRLVDCMPP